MLVVIYYLSFNANIRIQGCNVGMIIELIKGRMNSFILDKSQEHRVLPDALHTRQAPASIRSSVIGHPRDHLEDSPKRPHQTTTQSATSPQSGILIGSCSRVNHPPTFCHFYFIIREIDIFPSPQNSLHIQVFSLLIFKSSSVKEHLFACNFFQPSSFIQHRDYSALLSSKVFSTSETLLLSKAIDG